MKGASIYWLEMDFGFFERILTCLRSSIGAMLQEDKVEDAKERQNTVNMNNVHFGDL